MTKYNRKLHCILLLIVSGGTSACCHFEIQYQPSSSEDPSTQYRPYVFFEMVSECNHVCIARRTFTEDLVPCSECDAQPHYIWIIARHQPQHFNIPVTKSAAFIPPINCILCSISSRNRTSSSAVKFSVRGCGGRLSSSLNSLRILGCSSICLNVVPMRIHDSPTTTSQIFLQGSSFPVSTINKLG